MSSCSRASGRADVVAIGLVVQALPVASDAPQRLGETWNQTQRDCATSLYCIPCVIPPSIFVRSAGPCSLRHGS